MINFSVPDYTWNADLYYKILEFKESTLEHLWLPNRRIDSVYGMPGQLIWNGGRCTVPMDLNQAQNNVDHLREKGLKIKHVCTNQCLSPEHYYDKDCNDWLRFNENENDSLIIYDEELAKYLHKTYPKYKLILSTTKGKKSVDTHNLLNSQNIETVLFYSDNRNEDILKQLQYPEKVEIIACEVCQPNCPNRKFHYQLESKRVLQIATPEEQKWSCPQNCMRNFYLENKYYIRESTINNEWLEYIYNTYGFNNIKISGRTEPRILILDFLLYYLVQPEYRDILRFEACMNLQLFKV